MLPLFVATILLFLAPPGPDMVYVAAVGLDGGRRAAVAAILGIGTGMSIYAALVVLGLGRLAETHPLLLDAVKAGGAGYLLWLALMTVRDAHRPGRAERAGADRAYRRGVLVSLTNPKLMLFFLAVLPQFVGEAENLKAQLAMLGVVNVLAEVLLYGAIGVMAGQLQARVMGGGRAGVVMTYVAAVVYLTIGLVIARARTELDTVGVCSSHAKAVGVCSGPSMTGRSCWTGRQGLQSSLHLDTSVEMPRRLQATRAGSHRPCLS